MFLKRKAYYLLIGFIYVIAFSVQSQDQRKADSLKQDYLDDKLEGEEKLKLLRGLAFNEINDLELAILYADELISYSKLLGNKNYLYSGYLN